MSSTIHGINTEGLTVAAIRTLNAIVELHANTPAGSLLEMGSIAALRVNSKGGIGSCCRTLPGHLKKLYAIEGAQHQLPLYLIANAGDVYGTMDNSDERVGNLGITYKCALRELDGIFILGSEPSEVGIPASKIKKIPKPKKKEIDQTDAPPKKKRKIKAAKPIYYRPEVNNEDVKVMVNAMEKFAKSNNIKVGEMFKVDYAKIGLSSSSSSSSE